MEISWDFAEIFSDQEPVSSEETKDIHDKSKLGEKYNLSLSFFK